MQLAARQLNQAASNVAHASQQEAGADVAKEMTAVQAAKTSNAESVAVARTASEMMGTLVDIVI